jgi:hypothetical protein
VRYWIYVYEDRSRKEEDIARTGPRGLKEGAVTRKSGRVLGPAGARGRSQQDGEVSG